MNLKFARGKFLLNHYRNIKRKHFDHHVVEDFVKVASNKVKRSIDFYRGRPNSIDGILAKRLQLSHNEMAERILRKRRSISKRETREYTDIDRAYSKYYEKIKARYRNYVKNLFPNPRQRVPMLNNSYPMQPLDEVKNTKKIQVQDGRWYNAYNNPEFRYRATHKARTFSNDLQNEEFDNDMGPPVALPSINDPGRSNRYQRNETVSNHYPSYAHGRESHPVVSEDPYESIKKANDSASLAANIFAQLQSQIVRKKRDTDDDTKSKFQANFIDIKWINVKTFKLMMIHQKLEKVKAASIEDRVKL